jgi:hypothetical protein
MASEQRRYRSYLLRLWQAGDGDMPEWRIVVDDVRTQERQAFASVDQLATFLQAQMRGAVTDERVSPKRPAQ